MKNRLYSLRDIILWFIKYAIERGQFQVLMNDLCDLRRCHFLKMLYSFFYLKNKEFYDYNDRNSQDSQDETEFVDFDESTTIAQRSVIGTDLRNMRKDQNSN